jgi:2-polyprenyl-3-methyl-5-hydroxy-6-metoxy-1,4-benzoquinol methylase
MKYEEKRLNTLDVQAVQEGNKKWWSAHTMSYDWKGKSGLVEFTPPWFEDIDRRFLHAARLFTGAPNPFEELMAINQVPGRRVLEIGCGMGFHSEMLARAGAELSAVDLSPRSVTATVKRLEQIKLQADVRQMDAEALDFPSESFDMVWSWGVIHHSSRTGRIVREIERVLRPGGDARIMVYNLEGMPAYITLVTRYLVGFWRGQSLDELLWQSTDGFSARFYSKDSLSDLLAIFFDQVETTVLGQDPDVIPLPQALRRQFLRFVSLSRQRALVRRRGAYLFAIAHKGVSRE